MGTAKRRSAGEGSVFKTSTGRWIAMLDLGADATGKRIRRKFSARTKGEVLDKLRTAKRAADDGLPLTAARDTVAELLHDFFERGLPATCKSDVTRNGYRWAIERHLIPGLGARRLRDLSADDVDAMLQAKAQEGLSRASLAHVHQVLKRALRWAERRSRVSRNVATLVDTPSAARRASKALSVSEARAVLSAARDDRLEALWALGLAIPSRPGELTGLSWDCVDFENGIIHFRNALQRDKKLGALKTEQSRRAVEAPAFVMDALRRRKVAQAEEKLAAGAAWSNDEDLVFTTVVGTPIDAANLRRAMRRLMKTAGVEGAWTVYELRHSAVSILSAAGVPLELIADAAGHKNARVTAVVYRHNLSPVVASARGPMDKVFGEDAATG